MAYVYTFKDVDLIVGGINLSEQGGYGAGDGVIEVRRMEDNAGHIMTADGQMIVSQYPVRVGEFIIKVNQGSQINKTLNTMFLAQEAGLVLYNVSLTDYEGQEKFSGAGYIPKPADVARGLNTAEQSWRIIVENLTMDFNPSAVVAPIG